MMSKRNRNANWEGILQKTLTPIFIVGKDRSIQHFNAGCESLTGWQAREVVGQVCNYRTDAPNHSLERMTSSLCPPLDAFAGKGVVVPVFLECRAGNPLPKLIRFTPLLDSKQGLAGLLGVITEIEPPSPAEPVSPLHRHHAELAAVRHRLRKRFGNQTLVFRSPHMRRILHQIDLAQHTEASLYLQGETGTGKEHLARSVHFGGSQQRNWFVPLDCRRMSLPEMTSILERLAEVHRIDRGSDARPQPGTVYLADVDLLSRDHQEFIVRELISEGDAKKIDLRLIASGTSPLSEGIREGRLREDFAAHMGTLVIELPPLRERGEDLPLLAQHFLEQGNHDDSTQISAFAEGVISEFQRYHWPGNLDELQMVIAEARENASDGIIRLIDLPLRFRAGRDSQDFPSPQSFPPISLEKMLLDLERKMIRTALERHGFNKTKAAEMLGLNRPRLYRRMQQLNIQDLDQTRNEED